MAGDQTVAVWRGGLESRNFTAATLVGQRAAWMKRASGRRVERIGYFAGDGSARLARHVEVGHRIEQHSRVGMLWIVEQNVGRRQFDNASQIHDAHAI